MSPEWGGLGSLSDRTGKRLVAAGVLYVTREAVDVVNPEILRS